MWVSDSNMIATSASSRTGSRSSSCASITDTLASGTRAANSLACVFEIVIPWTEQSRSSTSIRAGPPHPHPTSITFDRTGIQG